MRHDQALDSKRVDCRGELERIGRDPSDPTGIANRLKCADCGAILFGVGRAVWNRETGSHALEAFRAPSPSPRQAKAQADSFLADLVRNFRLPPR